MIARPAVVTGLLLVVAVLSFASLAYQTVLVNTTQTMTQFSYSPYSIPVTAMYTTIAVHTFPYAVYLTQVVVGADGACAGGCPVYVTYFGTYSTTYNLNSTYEEQQIFTITETQTLMSSSVVPASKALGLTDGLFIALAVVVVVGLIVVTILFAFKFAPQKPKQAKLSQFIPTKPLCVKCGIELPPKSKFCNNCGTEQP